MCKPVARVPPVCETVEPLGTDSAPALREPVVAVKARVEPAVTVTPTIVKVAVVRVIAPLTVAPELASKRAVVVAAVGVPVTVNVLLPLSAIVPTHALTVRVNGVPIVVVAPAKGP